MQKTKTLLTIIFILIIIVAKSQNTEKEEAQIHGNFQTDMQYYIPDSLIGADTVPEHFLLNSYANFTYTKGNFTAGARFEGYLNTMQGFVPNEAENNGIGFPYRFASYGKDDFEFTIGSFYEQFGNGLLLRTYEEKTLGYDNAFDGLRVKYSPYKGIYLKGLVGKQRKYFTVGEGIVRGFDGEILINDVISSLTEKKTKVIIGGSFVSKYQEDKDLLVKLPENVGAFAGRFNVASGKINVSGEYAYKINDPSTENRYIYKDGQAALLNASFSTKGLGVLISAKRVDNMGFRSDRTARFNDLSINSLPAISRNHAYSLTSLYPYSTQPNGEAGLQAEVIYKFKKGSVLGGEYGTNLVINYSRIHDIERTAIDSLTPINQEYTLGYKSDFFAISKDLFFEDFNIEISKKINSKIKAKIMYLHINYNISVLEQESLEAYSYFKGSGDIVESNIGIIDVTYKFTSKKSIRFEVQNLFTQKHYGDWTSGLLELTVPNWFFSVSDQYNYGNIDPHHRIHYYNVAMGYNHSATRFQLSYGKQKNGIVCVGGICREVPASNGFMLSITTSF